MSAYGAFHRLMVFFLLPVMGVSQGYQPIAGFNFGAGQLDRVRRVTFLAMAVSTAVATMAATAVFGFPDTLLRLFTSDPELRSAGVMVARRVTLGMPAMGVYLIGVALYQALGKAIPAIVLGILRHSILIPIMFPMGRVFGVVGVLAASPIASALAMTVAVILIARQMRVLRTVPEASV